MGPERSEESGRGKWMALAAALLGWMFDGAEMGVFSLVGRQALLDLFGKDTPEETVGLWFGVITAGFLVGAATGGVLFGWLGDRIGRVRAMTLSVLTYAVFTGLCGLSTAPWQIGVLRFIAALGMGGEWSLGVALVMEVMPNKSRAFMAGLIGAAANVGYLMVAVVSLGLNPILADFKEALPSVGFSVEAAAWLTANKGWRLLMIGGTIPALLTFFIRLFVPESERWEHEQAEGRASQWQARDLLGVLVGVLGPALIIYVWATDPGWIVRIVGSLVGMAVTTGGYLYPAFRYLQRLTEQGEETADTSRGVLQRMVLAAGLSSVALLGTWCTIQWAPTWADKLAAGGSNAKEFTQIWASVGAIVGTILAAMMGDWFGRRITYSLLCASSLGSVLLLYQGNSDFGPFFLFTTSIAGFCTASFYGWLPLYLPELFRTRVRATGQGFGFNFGRIIAAVGVLQTGNLMGLFGGGYPEACSVMGLIYLVGLGIIWLAPETRGRPLPD
ncbi:MAG: MFS transporter [Gemmataceae bacterium]|nr:MFS transporter [Gemmataceae bacterium]